MSIQYVNTGSSANAGNGDSIRLAFTKVNNNFGLVATQVADLQQGIFDNITIAGTATFLDIVSTGTAQLNNVSIAGTVSGTSTFESIVVQQVATINDLHANTISSTNTATFEDVVVNGTLFGDFSFNKLDVVTTVTTNDLNVGNSIFIGQYQFIQTNNLSQDFAIVKDDINGLTFVLRNVHADSYAEINLQDNIQGGLSLVHQDSTNNSGNYDAGQNYIFGQIPTDTLNIGKYSDINFYASEARYYDPGLATTPSINISKTDGLVRFGSDTVYLNNISFQVATDGSALVNGIPLQGTGGTGTGYTGSAGLLGFTGSAGTNGNNGFTGSAGLRGFTGSAGASGFTGSAGTNGNNGYTGSFGNTGYVGSAGTNGNNGYTGSGGTNGNNGYTGSVGFGYSGSKGDTGAQGVSVTLVGSTGTSAGLPLTGNPGDGWIVSDTGNLWFWNTISSSWNDIGAIVGPQGNAGANGDQGLPGNNGSNGYNGSAGSNGADGYTGSVGNIGYTGSFGFTGYDGSIGSTGYTGSVGDIGYTGSVGDIGYTGSRAQEDRLVNSSYEFTLGSTGTLTAPGHILPSTDLAYDLGSTTTQWRSIYVGTGTIFIGGVALGVNADNYVTVDGNPIITVDTASNLTIPGETDLSIVVGGGSLGNVEVAEVDEWAPPGGPGGVWRLFIGDEAYPTLGTTVQIGDTVTTSWGTPITATITDIQQDNGKWQIYVEQDITAGFNYYDTVTFSSVSGKTWTFSTNGNLTFPQGTLLGYSDPGGFIIDGAVDKDIAIYTYSGADAHGWTFGTDGVLTLPSGNTRIGDVYGNGNDAIVGSTGTSVGVITQGTGGYVGLQWIDNPDLIGTTSTQVASVIVNSPIASTTGTVQILTGITTGTGIGSNIWEFGVDGNLTIPDDIQDANGSVVRVATTSTAPTRVDGQLWFDNQEGRLYIKNDGVWLDASPTQIPSPETYLDGLAIDGTVIGTANVNGDAIVIDGGDNTKLTVSNNSVTIQVPGSLTRTYWAAEFGGITTAVTTSSYTVGTGAFYDSQGNVYVLGGVQFESTSTFGLDSLLLKYDTNGNLLWSRTWRDDSGANCGAINQAFAIDSNDRIYWLATAVVPSFGCWTGYMDTEGNLGLGGVAQASLGFLDGAFAGVDIACDNSGNYYLAGAFYDGSETPVVIKVDGDSGVPIWTGSIVPEDFESLPSDGVYRAVTVNPATGDVWAIGDYNDGGLRAMLSKWDINGTHQWTKELVTVTGDVASAVIYNGGYVYTIVNDDPDQKAVVSKFDTDGVLIWASFLAVGALDPIPNNFGDYNTGAYDLSFDAVGNVYVTGTIPGPPAGDPQLWITKLDPTTGEMLYSRMLATSAGTVIFDQGGFGSGISGHRVGDIYQDTIVVTAVTESDIDDNTGTNALRVIVAQLPIDGSVTGTFDNIDIIDITGDIDSICSTGTYTVTTLVWSTGTSTAIYSTSSISVSTVTDVIGLTGETIALGSGTAGGSTTTNTWTFVNNNIILPIGGDILDSYGNSVLGDRYIALPSWITVVADTQHLPTLNTDYGWDSSGAWSTNATILGVEEPEGTSFPFRTTFSIPNDTKSVTTVDFVVNDLEESDFGITVFASGTTPTWEWGGSGSSIDAKYTPTELYGISGGTGGGEGWTPPSLGTYRARLTVDPTGPGTADITLETLSTGGTVLDTITYTETEFFNTSYKIGFASDNDGGVNKTYFKNLTINIDNGATVYTDTLMNGNSVGGSTTALGDRLTAGSNSVVLSSTGTLTLPNGGIISDGMGAIRLEPSEASSSTQALVIYPTVIDGNHIHLTAGGPGTDLYLGSDSQYVKVDHSGTIVVGTLGANTSTWTFGTDGVLTLSTASVILGNSTDPNVYIETLTTSTTNTWTFAADGSTTLPIGVSIDESNGSHFPRIVADTGKAFSIQGYGSTGSVALQWAETASTSSQIAQVGLNKFGDGLAKVVLTAGTSTNDMKVWEFAADGKLTLPGALVKSTVAKTGVILPTTTGIPNALGGSMTGLSLANGTYGPVTIGSVTFSVTVASGNITSFFDISSTSSYAVNATIGQLTSEDLGDSPGQTTNIGVDSVVQETPTALDLTKSVNKLADGYYTLADGVEGQIMYLVRQTGAVYDAVFVTVDSFRYGGDLYTPEEFEPFKLGGRQFDVVTLIYTDDAWQSSRS